MDWNRWWPIEKLAVENWFVARRIPGEGISHAWLFGTGRGMCSANRATKPVPQKRKSAKAQNVKNERPIYIIVRGGHSVETSLWANSFSQHHSSSGWRAIYIDLVLPICISGVVQISFASRGHLLFPLPFLAAGEGITPPGWRVTRFKLRLDGFLVPVVA